MIKRVKITDFMSVKSEIWSDLDPRNNVIAGVNGSGKSTYLRAIRFVLTNDFPCTTSAEKFTILNDPKKFARVDILIDNEDNRFQFYAEILCFSRQLDMKKDLYFINNTRIVKSEFMKHLQKANFSIKRPIYIVPQGEARRLTLISNEERLKILEEVSGYREFKEQENLINKQETVQNKLIDIIAGALDNFDGKLDFLKVDVSELQEFERLKKESGTIERIVLNRKLQKIEKNLRDWEEKGKKNRGKRNNWMDDFLEKQEREGELLTEINTLNGFVKKLEKEKKDLIFQKESAANKGSELEDQCAYFQKELEIIEKQEKKSEAAHLKMNEHIQKMKDELLFIMPTYEKEAKELENLEKEMDSKDKEVAEIYARKARARQFSSMVEKDKWIENEVSKLQNEIEESKFEVKRLDEKIEQIEEKKSKFQEEIKNLDTLLEAQKSVMESDNKKLADLNEKMALSSQKLSNLRDEQIKSEEELSKIESELAQVNEKFRKTVPKKILNGIESVKKVLQIFREREESTNGYFGLLIDLFRITEEKVKLAVENTAGNRLFHFVVATDELATRIVEEMNKLDLPGEANFLPLDRMRFLKLESNPKDAFQMLTYLEYDLEHDGAIRSVFGRTLICRDLDSANEYAKCFSVECLTLSGDQVFGNGNIVGGYQEESNSRIHIYEKKKKLEIKSESFQERLEEIRKQISEENQGKIRIENEKQISNIIAKLKLAKDSYAEKMTDLETQKLELNSSLEHLAHVKKMKALHESKLEILQSKISNLEEDLNQDLTSQLTEEEERHVMQLLKELSALRKQIREKEKIVTPLRNKKENAESFLNDERRNKEAEEYGEEKKYFISQREELTKNIEIRKSMIFNLNKEDPDFEYESKLRNVNLNLENVKKKKKSFEKELEKVVQEKEELEKKLKILDRLMSEIDTKIKELENERSQFVEKIRSLAFTKSVSKNFEKFSALDLERKLEKLNTKIRKMKVNPRARDLLTKINIFKEPFKTDLENNNLSENFNQFLSESEQIAKEVLAEEFRELSKNFDKYFKRFVPIGSGELKKCPAHLEADETFTGIDVTVSFSGQEKKNLKSLSGGEKSIVSLALIFANSIKNPPPFYIFDEVDAALSETNVKILAGIINEIKWQTQIFTSTFNPRMMQQGDNLYKAIMKNNVSHIRRVDSVGHLLA
ncbi:structural maintenance of chromosomes protein 3-like [Belonocnema kinseyi]|uniref:structural maintenance of chromosomes protein 3-like n=1 Tax=Belonocnema kinseyi TaxID=2817044 RepID=UPI00143D26EA|nr:structural maintenance of chromosomes protein 3-like [Belonocnema kinseyi]